MLLKCSTEDSYARQPFLSLVIHSRVLTGIVDKFISWFGEKFLACSLQKRNEWPALEALKLRNLKYISDH